MSLECAELTYGEWKNGCILADYIARLNETVASCFQYSSTSLQLLTQTTIRYLNSWRPIHWRICECASQCLKWAGNLCQMSTCILRRMPAIYMKYTLPTRYLWVCGEQPTNLPVVNNHMEPPRVRVKRCVSSSLKDFLNLLSIINLFLQK